jgi:hypothetical protein
MFVSISKQNVAFYSSFALRERKTEQQRSRKLFRIGKKEQNNFFFLKESKKRIDFDRKKKQNVDNTMSFCVKNFNYSAPFYTISVCR